MVIHKPLFPLLRSHCSPNPPTPPPLKGNRREQFSLECMHWEIQWCHVYLLHPWRLTCIFVCTFWHPHFWFCNVPMSTSLKHCTREILVLVYHMREERLELCKFKFSTVKAFFGRCDSPVKMSHASFPPTTNNLTVFLLAQFDEDFLDFWEEEKISVVALTIFNVTMLSLW